MLAVGKLYKITQYFCFLFPTKKDAISCPSSINSIMFDTKISGISSASYWSKVVGCNISLTSENCILTVLETDDIYNKIISTNGECGWIKVPKHSKWIFKELVKEKVAL